MNATNSSRAIVKDIAAILKDVWNAVENSGPCCGVRLDRPPRSEDMPTAGSCCGVRV